ncbi:MAG: ThiF family adenylyltransferase [Syntrophobacterales bacterium]|nr:ThiF family adenylyltransferase [Syntrophobacterales bacterium]
MIEISERDLLKLAQDLKISVGEATAIAIESGKIPRRYIKNLGAISALEQASICRSRVLVCGCGGLGGHVILLLARLGFGFLRIVDPDSFDPSNLNRQPFCMEDTLHRPKAIATKEILSHINPLIDVETFVGSLSPSHFVDVHFVIDGLDSPQDRIMAEKEAIKRGVPFIHGAVRGWWGQVTTIMPHEGPKLGLLYGEINEEIQKFEEQTGTLVPVVSLIASLQVHEAMRLAISKTPLYAGKLLYWDGETGTAMVLPFDYFKTAQY